jgi:BirA family biotin operon repressor/biotin-[acetyl-CoA-carboxylase] ligase
MNLSPRSWHLLTLLADGEFYSGEVLAQCLGVSRATVCNALDEATQLDIGLQRVRGRGYRLSQPWQKLNHTKLIELLGDTAARLTLDIQPQASSTNAVLLQRVGIGALSGNVLAVELQTAGRGRLGRTWHSELGNALTFSMLWRFNCGFNGLAGLSLAVGIAIVRAIDSLGIDSVQLKWPNDVLSPHGKLGGILLEARGDMFGPCAVVIGIGLNCFLPLELERRIDQPASALNQLCTSLPDRNQLLAAILQHLVVVLDSFAQHGFAPFRTEWESRHAQQNQTITLNMPDGSQCVGIALGVTDTGELRLETANGIKTYHSGEVGFCF